MWARRRRVGRMASLTVDRSAGGPDGGRCDALAKNDDVELGSKSGEVLWDTDRYAAREGRERGRLATSPRRLARINDDMIAPPAPPMISAGSATAEP